MFNAHFISRKHQFITWQCGPATLCTLSAGRSSYCCNLTSKYFKFFRFNSSQMWRCVVAWVAFDVSENGLAFILRVNFYRNRCMYWTLRHTWYKVTSFGLFTGNHQTCTYQNTCNKLRSRPRNLEKQIASLHKYIKLVKLHPMCWTAWPRGTAAGSQPPDDTASLQ